MYRCNHTYKNPVRCKTPALSEADFQTAFMKAVNLFLDNKDEYIAKLEQEIVDLGDIKAMNDKLLSLQKELGVVVAEIQKVVNESGKVDANREECTKKYNSLLEKYNAGKETAENLEQDIAAKVSKKLGIQSTLSEFKKLKAHVEEFDEVLWGMVLDHMTIHTTKNIIVTFRGGFEIEVSVAKK